MFSQSIYEPTQISSLFKPSKKISIKLRRLQPSTTERTLIISALHMLLGLPSQIFRFAQKQFKVNQQLLQLNHISHQLLQNQMAFFIALANQLQDLREYIKEVINCQQIILQAFGVGLHKVVTSVEVFLSDKLKVVQQQQGQLARNEQQYHANRLNPTTILSFSTDLIEHNERLLRLRSLIDLLPDIKSLNNEDSQNIGLFIINVYYSECQKEYLTGVSFPFHTVFAECLKVYLETCKHWIAVDEKELLATKNTCFFIDISLSLSKDREKIFQTKKIIIKQKVPKLLMNHYRKIFELGKTVQFIKLYLKEQQLSRFAQFFSIHEEFGQLQAFIQHLSNVKTSFFAKYPQKRTQTSINSRIGKQKIANRPRKQAVINDFFGYKEQTQQFFYLRSQLIAQPAKQTTKMQIQKIQNSKSEYQLQNLNGKILNLLDGAIQRLTSKCKAILRQKRIRQSIDQALRGIKKFVLLEQGDFVQQFLQISEAILERPTEKISRNNVERLIEQAIKNSALVKEAQSFKEAASFVFLRNEQGSMKGWRTFSFAFQSQTPVSCIFNSQSMQSYQYIGNLLFNMRRCEQILVSYWSHPFFNSVAQLLQARNAVHRFVCALQSYIFAEIQEKWGLLVQKFQSCDNVLGLIEANHETVQKLRQLTIQNKSLCNSMLSLIKIIERFEVMRRQNEEARGQNFKADLEQIWSWFLSLLDQSKQIRNFADSFDFKLNYY